MNKSHSRFILPFIIFSLFIPSLVGAGTTGKIAGIITDESTGDPLPGVNIIIVGTMLGAMTDLDGDYFILNVPPGTYTIRAQMLGYQTQEQQNVKVSVDVTTETNFKLKETVIDLGTEIVVVSDRPLIQKDVTTKTATLSSQQIENMPVTNIQGIMETQAGVVAVQGYNNKVRGFEERGIDQIHVRGGRNAEVAYMIDGMYVEDPIYGGRGTNINREAINELKIITGNFNAEYGDAMSQVVNIVTKEGGTKYSGMVEHSAGEVAGWLGSESDDLRDAHDALASFGGPVPFIRNMNFFLSGEHSYKRYALYEFDGLTYDTTFVKNLTPDDPRYNELQRQIDAGIIDDPAWNTVEDIAAENSVAYWNGNGVRVGDVLREYAAGYWRTAWSAPHPFYPDQVYNWDSWSGWHAHGFDQNYDFSGKLTYRINPSMKLTMTDRFTRRQFRSYVFSWQYAQDGQNIGTIKTNQQGINWTHTLSSNTFYTLILNGFWIERKMRVHGLADGNVAVPGENDSVLGEDEYSDIDTYQDFQRNQFAYHDTSVTIAGDTVVDVRYEGASDRYFTRNGGQRWNADLDLTSQINKHHQIKTGLEYTRYNPLFFSEKQLLYLENPYGEEYSLKPEEGAFYVQDKIEYPNLVINAGIRFDYANSKGWAWKEWDDPTAGVEQGKKKFQISPRLGIGYPITDKSTFHFAYGHFFQNPEYRNIYISQWDPRAEPRDLTTALPLLGNANLEAQKTVSFEIGVRQQIGDVWAVDATLWSKEMTGNAGTVNVIGFDADSIGLFDYYIFTNYDYGTARGIDLTIEKRFSDYFAGNLNYTYSVAKANRYYSWTGYWGGQTAEDEPKREILMDYDRTHMLDLNTDIRFPTDFGPSIGGVQPFENLYFNFLVQIQSGQPYTPYRGSKELEPNSARRPMYFTIDMVLRREFETAGLRYGVFARIFNLLDRKNALTVYAETGSPTDPGSTVERTDSHTYYDRPHYYGPRRSIDVGFRLYF